MPTVSPTNRMHPLVHVLLHQLREQSRSRGLGRCIAGKRLTAVNNPLTQAALTNAVTLLGMCPRAVCYGSASILALRPCVQAPLATKQELAGAHCSAYVQRALDGRLTDREQRAIGLPWSSSLATYARQVMASSILRVLVDLIISFDKHIHDKCSGQTSRCSRCWRFD